MLASVNVLKSKKHSLMNLLWGAFEILQFGHDFLDDD